MRWPAWLVLPIAADHPESLGSLDLLDRETPSTVPHIADISTPD